MYCYYSFFELISQVATSDLLEMTTHYSLFSLEDFKRQVYSWSKIYIIESLAIYREITLFMD